MRAATPAVAAARARVVVLFVLAAAGGVKQLRTLQRRLRLPLAAGGSEAATPIPV